MVVQPEHASTGDPERDDALRRAMIDDPVLRKRLILCHNLALAMSGMPHIVVAYSTHDACGYRLAQETPLLAKTAFQYIVDWHRALVDGGCDPRKSLVMTCPRAYGEVFNHGGGLDPKLAAPPTETEAVVVLVDYGGVGVYRVDIEGAPA